MLKYVNLEKKTIKMQNLVDVDLNMKQNLLESMKSFYLVFEAFSDDYFDYDEEKILLKTNGLDKAHSFAYEEWKKDQTKYFTIIQAYDGSFRGGYGFTENNK